MLPRLNRWRCSSPLSPSDYTTPTGPLYHRYLSRLLRCRRCAVCARSGPEHVQQTSGVRGLSITSSARASSEGGMVRPRILAAFKLNQLELTVAETCWGNDIRCQYVQLAGPPRTCCRLHPSVSVAV